MWYKIGNQGKWEKEKQAKKKKEKKRKEVIRSRTKNNKQINK